MKRVFRLEYDSHSRGWRMRVTNYYPFSLHGGRYEFLHFEEGLKTDDGGCVVQQWGGTNFIFRKSAYSYDSSHPGGHERAVEVIHSKELVQQGRAS